MKEKARGKGRGHAKMNKGGKKTGDPSNRPQKAFKNKFDIHQRVLPQRQGKGKKKGGGKAMNRKGEGKDSETRNISDASKKPLAPTKKRESEKRKKGFLEKNAGGKIELEG